MQSFWKWLKKRWIWVVLSVAALLSLTAYGVKAQEFNQRKEGATTVTGVVIRTERIVKEKGSDDGANVEVYYKVTYRYDYEGTTYHNTSQMDQNMREGKQIKVQIDPKDPTVVFNDGDPGLLYLMLGILFAVPVVFYAGFILRKKSFVALLFLLGAVGCLLAAAILSQYWLLLVTAAFGGAAWAFATLFKATEKK